MGDDDRPQVLARKETATGIASIITDPRRESGRFLDVDGFAQSYVDLDDPLLLHSDYSFWVASVLDAVESPLAPQRVLHLGGGAMTLPRYLHGIRPDAVQTVVEMDGPLVDFVHEQLPLPDGSRVEVRVGDASEVILDLPDDSYDIVISDVFKAQRMPREIACLEYAQQLSRVLRPDGTCVLNVLDIETLVLARLQASALDAVFGELCVVAAHTPASERNFLNIVMAATNDPDGLPFRAIGDAAHEHGTEVPLLRGDDLVPLLSGVEPLRSQS